MDASARAPAPGRQRPPPNASPRAHKHGAPLINAEPAMDWVEERARGVDMAVRAFGCTMGMTGRCLLRACADRRGRAPHDVAAAATQTGDAHLPTYHTAKASRIAAEDRPPTRPVGDGGFMRDAREQWAPAMFDIARAQLRVHGSENLKVKRAAVGRPDRAEPSGLVTEETGAVFVANHCSFMDIPACFASIPGDIRFVAKKSISYIPLVGSAMKTAGMVFVDRKRPEEAIEALRAGAEQMRGAANNIMAFPEGTRSDDGYVREFKKGVFRMAIDTQKPVVPCALVGTSDVLPKTGPLGPVSFRRNGTVEMAFGKPIPTEGLTPADVNRLVDEVRAEVIRLHSNLGGKGAAEAA